MGFFDIIDLPLLVTIYYGITKREPMSATVVGAAIGIAQDALTHHALGIFGIAKSIVGYIAASLGVRVDTENHGDPADAHICLHPGANSRSCSCCSGTCWGSRWRGTGCMN